MAQNEPNQRLELSAVGVILSLHLGGDPDFDVDYKT